MAFLKFCLSKTTPDHCTALALKIIQSISNELVQFPEIIDFIANSMVFQSLDHATQKVIKLHINAINESNPSIEKSIKIMESKLAQSFITNIRFIVNNLTASNYKSKSKRFDSLIENAALALKNESSEAQETPYEWVVAYIVCQRCAEEPDCHDQYIGLLNESEFSSKLMKLALSQCFSLIKEMLRCNRSVFDSVVRRKLSNMGELACRLTMLDNKPLHADDLSLDKLLYESYRKGIQEVEIVLPFVVKFLLTIAGPNEPKISSQPNAPDANSDAHLLEMQNQNVINIPNDEKFTRLSFIAKPGLVCKKKDSECRIGFRKSDIDKSQYRYLY